MNKIWTIGLLLSYNASAITLPSVLPDGTYRFECAAISVVEIDPSEVRSNSELKRYASVTKGIVTYMATEDTVTTQESSKTKHDDHTVDEVLSTETAFKDLGDGVIEETVSTKSRTKVAVKEGGEQLRSDSQTWKRKVKVDGNFTYTLNFTLQDGIEQPGRGESATIKHDDGTFTIINYSRRSIRMDAKEISPGLKTTGSTNHIANSNCKFTPLK